MIVVLSVPVFGPLLQLAVLANLLRAEFGDHLLQGFSKRFVAAQNRGGFNAVSEQIQHKLLIPSRTVGLLVELAVGFEQIRIFR